MGVKEDFERLPMWGQVAVFAVIGVLILAAFYFMYYKNAQQQIETLNQELSQLKREITKGREAKKRRQQLEIEIERIEAKINQLKRILPEEVEIQRVFDEVTNRVKDAGLQLLVFTPQPIVSGDQPYRVHPQQVTVTGSYHSLGRFFERLASMNRLVNVEGFSIRVRDPERRPPLLEVTMRIVTYTYVEPGEGGAGP